MTQGIKKPAGTPGGNTQEVRSGGSIVVKDGGSIVVQSGGQISVLTPRGTIWFADSTVSASGNGLSWAAAFKTVTEAVAAASAGDVILIQGSFNEAVEVAVAGLSLIGAGTTSNRALWTAPDTVAPCLTINAVADCLVQNIRFRPAVANAGIELIGAAHQTQIVGCRFQGKANSKWGIKTDGKQANVLVKDCEFFYLNTATHGHGIYGHTYDGAEPAGWRIEDCIFHSNTQHIVCRMRQSVIQGCVFAGKGLTAAGSMAAPSKCIDISGATGGCNIVTKNLLGGDYSTALYVPGTDDDWVGNFSADVAEDEVADNGVTIAVPAA